MSETAWLCVLLGLCLTGLVPSIEVALSKQLDAFGQSARNGYPSGACIEVTPDPVLYQHCGRSPTVLAGTPGDGEGQHAPLTVSSVFQVLGVARCTESEYVRTGSSAAGAGTALKGIIPDDL
jgi:hypothetical protein